MDYGKGDEWGPLPGSELEARNCADLFSRAFADQKAVLLRGDRATPAALMKAAEARVRYLHLATHGFFEKPEAVERLGPQMLFKCSAVEQVDGVEEVFLAGHYPTPSTAAASADTVDLLTEQSP